jgi:hypothetical protein
VHHCAETGSNRANHPNKADGLLSPDSYLSAVVTASTAQTLSLQHHAANRIRIVKPLNSIITAIFLAALLLAVTAANAERTFKWIDAEGNTHYGDRVPLQNSAQQRQEINDQGRTLRALDKPTPEAIAEQKRQAALRQADQKALEEQAQQDKQLLASYATEDDILIARDYEVAGINEFIHLTELRIKSLQNRREELTGEAADYTRRDKPVPDFLQQQMTRIEEEITENEAIITGKQAEIESINAHYADDLARYQSLQSHKPPAP